MGNRDLRQQRRWSKREIETQKSSQRHLRRKEAITIVVVTMMWIWSMLNSNGSISSQKSISIGSKVKVDGDETDAYAFLTILNLHEHREKKIIKDLTEYLIEKSKSTPSLAPLVGLLTSSSQVGLVLGERLINVPAEIAPPMYTMLIDEIEAAVEDKEPYEFTHYLILSKTYNEISSSLDQEDAPRTKKNKAIKTSREVFYFHPEDEVLQKHALASGSFEYTKDEGEGMADSKRAFSEMGIKPQGSMIMIEASKFEGVSKAISEYLNAAQ